MQTLGTCYTYMDELSGLFEKLGLHPKRMKPQVILEIINTLETICRRKPFQNANLILEDSLATIVSATLLEMPFVNPEDEDLGNALDIATKLQLDRLFGIQPSTALSCSLLAASRPYDMKELLCNRPFQSLIGCNEYQGVRWYRGESFQECLYLAVLSKAIRDAYNGKEMDSIAKRSEEELRKWLDRSNQAQYRFERLLG